MFKFTHLTPKPILHVDDDARFEGNINGPSLIQVADWVQNRLGRYYLYFAHHEGRTIRMAFADDLEGPWRVVWPGVLALSDSFFTVQPPAEADLAQEARDFIAEGTDGTYPHIASPDVIVDEQTPELRMYFHGRLADGRQRSRVAVSKDGISWTTLEPVLGYAYFRVFRHKNAWFSLTMPGFFCRSADGFGEFEVGDIVFCNEMRHSAVLKRGNKLHVFWSRVGDAPERILHSTVDLSGDWRLWRPDTVADAATVHQPLERWEGASLPNQPSVRGAIMRPVNQLRDPAIFEEDGEVYLVYSLQGEFGLGIGKLALA